MARDEIEFDTLALHSLNYCTNPQAYIPYLTLLMQARSSSTTTKRFMQSILNNHNNDLAVQSDIQINSIQATVDQRDLYQIPGPCC